MIVTLAWREKESVRDVGKSNWLKLNLELSNNELLFNLWLNVPFLCNATETKLLRAVTNLDLAMLITFLLCDTRSRKEGDVKFMATLDDYNFHGLS